MALQSFPQDPLRPKTRLADKYTPPRLENACERALSYTPEPSLKNITVILQNGQNKLSHEKPSSKGGSKYGITRGFSYYGEGTFEKTIRSYHKVSLLILDEFLLSPLNSEQCHDLLEIIEARSVKGSVIFCTQFETEGWLDRLGTGEDATVAEAIIDRIRPNAYEIFIDGKYPCVNAMV